MVLIRESCPELVAGARYDFVMEGWALRQTPFDVLFVRNDSGYKVSGCFDGQTQRAFECGSGERLEVTDEVFNFISLTNEGAGTIAAGEVKITFQSKGSKITKWRRHLWG